MNPLGALLDVLFPPKCIFCGTLLPSGVDGVCDECRKTLPFTRGKARSIEGIPTVMSAFYYEGEVREALLRYKFANCSSSAKTFAKFMSETVENSSDVLYDTISWVPLSRRRERKRGYDQAYLLARSMARNLGREVTPTLRKVRHIQAQSGLASAEARRNNISGCYELAPGFSPAGKRILLVDDIVTTGSTLSECARMLKAGGAEEVLAVTAATAALH